jgi:hypothetical protein
MITAGITIGRQTEIISGLAAGELVAVAGASGLVDGARVRVSDAPATAGSSRSPEPGKN